MIPRSLIPLLLAALLAGCAAEADAPGQSPGRYRLTRVAVDPAGGGDATLSPDGRQLVTTSRRSGNWDLWIYDIPSGKWTQATDHPAEDFEGRWSPDGKRLAFTSSRGGHRNVWVLDLATRALRQLTFSEHEDEYPTWTPDGTGVLYTGGPWKQRDYFLVPATGGTPRRLSPESGFSGACAYDPDGKSLLCHRYDTGSGDVYRLWPADGEITPLTIGPAWDYKPAPSADGRWIAFSRSEEGPAHVSIMPAAGGKVRRLTDSPYSDRWPTWSASGHTLLFHRLVDHGTGLRLLDRKTGKVRTLAGPGENPLQASLDPGGERVVYCSQLPDRKVLKVLDLATGGSRRLDTGPGEACFPRWSPDGGWIAYAGKPGPPAVRWEVSAVRPDGTGRVALTAGAPGLRGMDGPLDWSPDGARIVFHADTEAYEANLFTVELATRKVAPVSKGAWFDEAPSYSPDGRHLLFMSTRAGDWTWGLFRQSLADGRSEMLAGPDWEEKNFPRMARDGAVVWSAFSEDRKEHLTERAPSGEVRVLKEAGEGARWPSYSADGRSLLYTTVSSEVELWLAENVFGAGSPLHEPRREQARAPAAAALVPAAHAALADGRSPVHLQRR